MQPLAFVDLETTGAPASIDRITEIGITQVDERGVEEWSTLINAETRISGFIEELTGISNDMMADAPRFSDVASRVNKFWMGESLWRTTPDLTMTSIAQKIDTQSI